MGRGGKEGNNALAEQPELQYEDVGEKISHLSEKSPLLDYFLDPGAERNNYLYQWNNINCKADNFIHSLSSSGFYKIVAAGNQKLAAFLVTKTEEFENMGMNKLHKQALTFTGAGIHH